MAKGAITFDAPGEHFYETGVNHCVLFLYDSSNKNYGTSASEDNVGVAWNGITSISESPKVQTSLTSTQITLSTCLFRRPRLLRQLLRHILTPRNLWSVTALRLCLLVFTSVSRLVSSSALHIPLEKVTTLKATSSARSCI